MARRKSVEDIKNRWLNPTLSADNALICIGVKLRIKLILAYGQEMMVNWIKRKAVKNVSSTDGGIDNAGAKGEPDDSVVMASVEGSFIGAGAGAGVGAGDKVVEAHILSKSHLEDSPPPPIGWG